MKLGLGSPLGRELFRSLRCSVYAGEIHYALLSQADAMWISSHGRAWTGINGSSHKREGASMRLVLGRPLGRELSLSLLGGVRSQLRGDRLYQLVWLDALRRNYEWPLSVHLNKTKEHA